MGERQAKGVISSLVPRVRGVYIPRRFDHAGGLARRVRPLRRGG